MKTKGQIAFESLLVLLMVISAVIMITTLYLQFHNETVALGYARTGALEELSNQEKNVVIEIDEPHHYDMNGNLREKDKKRQKEIESILECKFIRIRI